MASKTFSGQLDQAMNEAAAEGNKILFIPQQTVGEVLPGAASELMVESDGTYSIKLAYNTYSIYHYSDVTKRKTLLATDIVVSTDTAVTTIPDLLGSVVPVTEDSVLTIQGYLDEANDAKTDAETAQAAAETAQSETEALFDDFDSNVAGSMALVYTDTPSLGIPFNESGRLDYGVGTEYVSGLPVYGVNFTCSTGRYYINKSGNLSYADIDEIAIGRDGVYNHGAYTVSPLYTNDITQATYSKVNGAASASGNTWSGLNTYNYEASSAGSAILRYLEDFSGSPITAYIIAKASGGVSSFSIRITDGADAYVEFDLDSGTYSEVTTPSGGATMTRLSDGFYLCTVSVTSVSSTSTVQKIAQFTADSAGDYLEIAYTGFSSTAYPAPLHVNAGTSSSISPAYSYVTTEGNIPPNGNNMTISVDAFAPKGVTTNKWLFDADSLYARYSTTNRLIFAISGMEFSFSGIDTDSTLSNLSRHTITIDYDSEVSSLYINGDLVQTLAFSDAAGTLDLDDAYADDLYVGKYYSGGQYLYGPHKNFKIYHYAASADEVKSWGAPK